MTLCPEGKRPWIASFACLSRDGRSQNALALVLIYAHALVLRTRARAEDVGGQRCQPECTYK